jgi:hypothetical protein
MTGGLSKRTALTGFDFSGGSEVAASLPTFADVGSLVAELVVVFAVLPFGEGVDSATVCEYTEPTQNAPRARQSRIPFITSPESPLRNWG